ncbi:MAG: 3-hydroxybutyrate oligomer hydrolase family protein [Pseudomarimonas sp.]
MKKSLTICGSACSPIRLALSLAVTLLTACAVSPQRAAKNEPVLISTEPTQTPFSSEVRVSEHRGSDDLLSAGLGLSGLRVATPPSVADANVPTSSELRRRALWSNWRGIADLSPAGGYGDVYGGVPNVPGREFHTFMRLPAAKSPHRVMLQLPDAFDAGARCLLVTASSGSRGIYGAIAVAGAWGLPRGCAVVYTDKGGGTDLFDAASGEGPGLDGRLTSDPALMAFHAEHGKASPGAGYAVGYKHANSQDNPEANWGNHLYQATEFALQQLNLALPAQAPFTMDNTRIIAVGLSNAGGAVLRAAERDAEWLDGVVAVAPNVLPGEGGRPLFDYATDAALWMTCAQAAKPLANAPMPFPMAVIAAQREAACAALVAAGMVGSPQAAADEAYQHLRGKGWSDAALGAGMLSTAFDLWRGVGVTYASAYGRYALDQLPCDFAFAAVDATGAARAASVAERSLWWSDGPGIAPSGGVQIVGGNPDLSAFERLQCLRDLYQGDHAASQHVRAGIEATRARLPRADLPILLVHGVDDGLVPEAFSGGAYVDWVRRAGDFPISHWRVNRAQHFDAFLALPAFGSRYVPLLPYAYAGLDAMWQQLEAGTDIADATFQPTLRGMSQEQVKTLSRSDLGLDGG